MKKLIFTLSLLLLPLLASAQVEIDEEDLQGKWALESAEGNFNYRYYNSNGREMLRPDSIEIYNETRHTEYPESLGVVKYYEGQREYLDYNPNTGEEIHTGKFYDYYSDMGISDIFITKNDVLHLLLKSSHYAVRYRILAYDGETISLQTMDREGYLVYRKQQATRVSSTRSTPDDDDNYYTLKGTKSRTKPKGEAYIRKGKVYLND
jgi:hypothetical protein